ncbi:MAG: hypothetical protein ABI972_27125 [Acidobacteriota bacterium]
MDTTLRKHSANVGELLVEVVEGGLQLGTAAGMRSGEQFALNASHIQFDQLPPGRLLYLFGSENSLFYAHVGFGLRLLGLDFFTFPIYFPNREP